MLKALELHTPKGELPANAEPEQIALFRQANQLRASLLDDSWPKKVAAFRRLYLLSEHNNPSPAVLSTSRQMLHRAMLDEERDETFYAAGAGDLSGTVDGLLDLIYVALGWLLELGFTPQQIDLLMEEVHASNMTKTDDHGAPVFDTNGKVLKGDNYVRESLLKMVAAFSVGLSVGDIEHG
jgi:hypothetical protein